MALGNEQQDQVRRIVEFLNHDRRPTFVFDVHNPYVPGTRCLDILFLNDAITRRPRLEARLLGHEEVVEELDVKAEWPYKEFVLWATSPNEAHCQVDLGTPAVSFLGLHWDFYTIEQRWRVVSASARDLSANRSRGIVGTTSTSLGKRRDHELDLYNYQQDKVTLNSPLSKSEDDIHIHSNYSNMMRELDWSSTPMGPQKAWPETLHVFYNFAIMDPNPAILYWGPDFSVIYNEAAIPIMRHRHPQLMGQRVSDVFPELWAEYEPMFRTASEIKQPLLHHNVPVYMNENGRSLQEHYFNYIFMPLFGLGGEMLGIYLRLVEVSSEIISLRRASILRRITQDSLKVTELKQLWLTALKCFEDDSVDISVALIYSVQSGLVSEQDSPSSTEAIVCTLEGFVGTSHEPPEVLSSLKIEHDVTGMAELLRRGIESFIPQRASIRDSGEARSLFNGVHGRGFGEPCVDIVICPIRSTKSSPVVALLVVGLNHRNSFDSAYQSFIRAIQRQLSLTATSVQLLAEERHRGRTIAEQASVDEAKLKAQITAWTKEADKNEKKFKDFVQRAPVGVNFTNTDGDMYFANDMFYDLSGYDRNGSHGPEAWRRLIYPEDIDKAETHWKRMWEGETPSSTELRVNRRWTPPGSFEEQPFSWLLVSYYLETRNDTIGTIITCVTDINDQKWAENVQVRRTNDAILAKQQQDEFIDMTSHEMRNPLSAVLQCADEIIASATKDSHLAKNGEYSSDFKSSEVRRVILDAAQTIHYCTQHQRRIVDDILTMSKLNSNLMSMSPSAVQPMVVIEEGIRLCSHEMKAADIRHHLKADDSLTDLGVDWVWLDRGRFTQILLNILGNAIKFTKPEAQRWINVHLSAFKDEPSFSHNRNTPYIKPGGPKQDPTNGVEWGSGDQIFLEVTVEDSGPGLTDDQSERLFQRFSQATHRTHVQYGGSGLGLFICRALAEMHGGRVGFATEPGRGSVFAFYLKCRRIQPLPNKTNTIELVPQLANDPSDGATPPNLSPSTIMNLPLISGLTISQEVEVSVKCEHDVLIVEDNVTNQRVLARQLQRLGYRVTVANHGKEALDHVFKTRFWKNALPEAQLLQLSIIFCDIEMPIMDGFEFVATVRKLECQGTIEGHIPVVAITGNARAEQVAKAKEAGMDDVILKPFNVSALVEIMSRLGLQTTTPIVKPG